MHHERVSRPLLAADALMQSVRQHLNGLLGVAKDAAGVIGWESPGMSIAELPIAIDREKVAEFCRARGIRRLSLFEFIETTVRREAVPIYERA